MPKPAQFDNWPDALRPPYEYRLVVERIVDGDTLYGFLDLGLDSYGYESIRLKDVHAPELYTSDPIEKERGRLARSHLESICPLGTKCKAVTEKDRASFGRYVATLHLQDSTTVNDRMNYWLSEQGWL